VGTVVVDGNNVMGTRPDGWWRDRPAAVRRLLARVQCWAGSVSTTADVVLVLDVPQADLPAGVHDGVSVLYARRKGRDAADDRIVELLDTLGSGDDVEVVTSDRALASAASDRGATVTGARTFLDRLDRSGC
jgi:predicted RNA-binding protein with PIN domain